MFFFRAWIYIQKKSQRMYLGLSIAQPKITLSKEGKACLKRFKDLPKYLVTDGNKIVQLKKIQALGLEPYLKKHSELITMV